jgi:hypothetical protein
MLSETEEAYLMKKLRLVSSASPRGSAVHVAPVRSLPPKSHGSASQGVMMVWMTPTLRHLD